MKISSAIFTVILLTFLCPPGRAQNAVAQNAVPCLSQSGGTVLVPLYYTRSGGDFAQTSTLPNPAIYVDPAIATFSSTGQMLIFNHECHHATHTYINEDEADVYAGKLMRLNGISEVATRSAAEEVFRWTVANRGHSIPAVRVASVMQGYGEVDSSDGGGVARECSISAADIDAVDVSDAVPSYIEGSRTAIQRRLDDRRQILAESIEVCNKAAAKMRQYPGDPDFIEIVKGDKDDIAKDQAYLRKLSQALEEANEEFSPGGPALFSFAKLNYGDDESTVIGRLGNPGKRVAHSGSTELQYFADSLEVYLNRDGQVREIAINSLNDQVVSLEPRATGLIGQAKSALASRLGVRSTGQVDIGDYACRFAGSGGRRGELHFYFNDNGGKSNVVDVLWLRPNDRMSQGIAACK